MSIIQIFRSLLASKASRKAKPDDGVMTFQAAIEAHLEWKRCLVNTAAGWSSRTLKRDQIGTETHCALGQWLHGAGAKQFGGVPSFKALQKHHVEFHQLALQIIDLADAGRIAEAETLLNGAFRETSVEVVTLLRYLEDLAGL